MKLRLRGDSVRLRLTRGEVDRLRAGDAVAERVRFGPDRSLDYRLETGDVATPTATLETTLAGAVVRVVWARDAVNAWADSNDEGLEVAQPAGPDGALLRVFVQKDFACLAPREGDEDAGSFPHPDEGKRTC